ncbi:hypothetical protein Fot_18549 [Forsythia ovata]|uniref:Uncharacterized protein n=1 Tax=Forsythia ovata TaxID=205694 RepID=A0ABD1VJX8_9LAMI
MAKGIRGRRRIASRKYRSTPYPLPASSRTEDMQQKKCSKIFEKKDWEDATCSVCMECPHNAVLLLCSSHDKGCRPYMCGTSFRYSNCLDQYKKAYTKVTSSETHPPTRGSLDSQATGPFSSWPVDSCEVLKIACPLCRGQVKGWTVVEPAREYLNAKKRSCTQDNCSFVGTFKELRKHVKAEHPSARPREVDPVLEQKWRSLERERETEDVMSTIRSSMPGAVFFGDYVIEGSHYGFDSDEEDFDTDAMERNERFEAGIDRNLMNVFLLLQAFGSAGNVGPPHRGMGRHDRDSNHTLDRGATFSHGTTVGAFDHSRQHSESDEDNDNGGTSLASRLRRQGRVILGRSGRRRRRGEAHGGPR